MKLLVSTVVLLSFGFLEACAVKKTVSVPVSPKILAAKTATLDDLLTLLDSYGRKIETLSACTHCVAESRRTMRNSLVLCAGQSGRKTCIG